MKNPIRACYNNEDYYIKRLSIAADGWRWARDQSSLALWLVDSEPLHTAVLLLQLAENLAEDVPSLLRNKWRVARCKETFNGGQQKLFRKLTLKTKRNIVKTCSKLLKYQFFDYVSTNKTIIIIMEPRDVTAGDNFCVAMNREVTTCAWSFTRNLTETINVCCLIVQKATLK